MSLEQYLRYPDRSIAVEAALGTLISKTSARFLRKRLPASLADLAAAANCVYRDPTVLLTNAPWPDACFPPDDMAAFANEHASLVAELGHRYETRELAFPTNWAIERGTSLLLYSLVRGSRPDVVIEMGVANGHSSFFILNALAANGNGILHSFDVVPDVGSLLSARDRRLWRFQTISRRPCSLMAALASLPQADLCFHDADHGYLAQYFECGQLWEQLSERGMLVVDDMDASYGLLDFCIHRDRYPEVLVDGRKVVGVVSRGRQEAPVGATRR